MPRAKSIQIYLKDGLDEDDMLLSLWESCKRRSRPQVVFRRMLMKGFDAMVAEGELPQSITEEMKAIRDEDSFGGSRSAPSKPKTDGLDIQGAEVWQKLQGHPDDAPALAPKPRVERPPAPAQRAPQPQPSVLDSMMADNSSEFDEDEEEPPYANPRAQWAPEDDSSEDDGSSTDESEPHGFIGNIM